MTAEPAATTMLALEHATRYAGYGGTEEHRTAALALAAEVLASPTAARETIACGHLIIAWMSLTRQMTSEQRSVLLSRPDITAARRGEPEAKAILALLGEAVIDVPDAETAQRHLRQISDMAGLDEELKGLAATLSGLALLAIGRAGQVSEDADRVAEQLRGAAGQAGPGMPEPGELLAMRAALLATHSPGAGDGLDALQEAAAQLPEHHLVRPALLNQLAQSLGQEAEQAGTADDVAAEVGRIVAVLEQMPREDPQFAQLMTFVATRVFNLMLSHRDAVPLERLTARLGPDQLAPDDPLKPLAETMYWSAIGTRGAIQHRPDLLDEAVDGLMRGADRVPADHPFRPAALLGVAVALAERYVMTGEIRNVEDAERYVDLARAASGPAGMLTEPNPGYPMLMHVRTVLAAIRSQYDEQSSQDLTGMADDLERALSLVPPDHPLRPRLIADLETVRAVGEMRRSPAGPGIPMRPVSQEAFEKILAQAQAINRDHPDFPGLAAQAAAGLMLRALSGGDIAPMGQAISLLAEACGVPGLTYRERPRMLNLLGWALLSRYHLSRDRRDLSHAIDRLEEARRAVGQELGSPYAATVLQSLAAAYRTRGDAARGDVDRAVAIGLEALGEHAGDVLLQDSDENALRAARQMTSDAGEMARWFLRHGRAAAAIDALEFGRGTVLHAATAGARLAEVLQDAGHADLAAEWTLAMSHGQTGSEDLRYRIMTAIEGSPAEARLLAPPSLGEITAAMRARAVDALIYLLPRGDDGAGLAVLLEAGGAVKPLPLPTLQAGPGTPVGSFLRARRAAGQDWRAALGELCDWTWRAAIGPVLGAVPARSHGSRRIVLVPGGELGLVAWHAARQPLAGGYRYAMQEAVFSYASSARQFVDTARRQPRPWAREPVLISDAEPSLQTTATGICHLHSAHYPAAEVFGYARLVSPEPLDVPGTEAATQDDVLAALPHESRPGASLLHFGCHGEARVPVLGSRLNLGEGHTVAVEAILRQARNTSGQASGGLVVLASCLTDVAEADYDEAVTLATAFLSAGAVGVVAARWQVPDRDTALFMAAFHHYLNGSDRHPAEALRSAQVWMLDPGREPPGPLPEVLSDETTQADLADPAAWAGFGYQGW